MVLCPRARSHFRKRNARESEIAQFQFAVRALLVRCGRVQMRGLSASIVGGRLSEVDIRRSICGVECRGLAEEEEGEEEEEGVSGVHDAHERRHGAQRRNAAPCTDLNEQVRRLQVSMDDVRAVDVCESAEELEDEDLGVLRRQRLGCLQDAIQVRVHALKYDVQVFECSADRPRGRQHVEKLDDALVLQLAQNSNLAQDAPRVLKVVEHAADLRHYDEALRLLVVRSSDFLVRSASDELLQDETVADHPRPFVAVRVDE